MTGTHVRKEESPRHLYDYYAALLPRRGPHIASHSVRPSVCLSVCLSVCPSVRPVIIGVTSRHLANYNETHVLFGMHRGPHIVRPSRPHKLVNFSVGQRLSNQLTFSINYERIWRGVGKNQREIEKYNWSKSRCPRTSEVHHHHFICSSKNQA